MPTPATRGLLAASLLAGAALLAARPAAAQRASAPLSATERAIVQAVDSNNARALALLERLVNINSGTMHFAGVRDVGDALRAQFDSLGFTTRWVDGAPFHRAGDLVVEHPGPGPKILLIGHLDTVFEESSPFQKFEMLNDSTARGPGVIDMKGGDVIALYALKALKEVGALDGMHIVAVFDGDEEDAGTPLSEARRALTDAAVGASAAIGFEDGAGDPRTLVIARRGDVSWTLHSTGTAAHSSLIFTKEVGAGAVFESARVLDEFYRRLGHEQYLTFNPGLAVGGTAASLDSAAIAGTAQGKTNVVAQTMTVTGDVRTLTPAQLARTERTMREIVAHSLPLTSSSITFDDGYPPMAPTAGNRRLLAMYDQVSRDLGTGPVTAVDPARAGAADVSFIAGEVPMVVDAAGLSGHGGHTVNETADLRMLPVKTRRAAVLLYRLARAAGKEAAATGR